MKRGISKLRRPSGRPGKICLSHMEVPSGNSEYGLKTKNLGRTVTGTAHQCSSPVCKVTNLKTSPFSAGGTARRIPSAYVAENTEPARFALEPVYNSGPMFLLAAFTPRRSLRPYLYTLGAVRRLAAPALRCGFTSLDSGNMFKTNLP